MGGITFVLPQRFPLMPSLPLATKLTLTWSMTPPVFTLLGMSFYYKVLPNQSFAKLVRAFLSQEWKSHVVQYFRSVGSRVSLPKQAFPQTCSCPTADPEANHDPWGHDLEMPITWVPSQPRVPPWRLAFNAIGIH